MLHAATVQERGEAVGDWFNIIEDSHYRRRDLLAEADRNRRSAAVNDTSMRTEVATLLIKVALWLAPATATLPRRTALSDERVVPRIARI